MQSRLHMSKTPLSMDEIDRKTLPNLDTSMRPSKEQVEAAYDGTHTRGEDERKLYAAVQAKLQGHADAKRITLDIRNDQVELRGHVTHASAPDEIERLVRDVPGVGSVTNKLIVT